MEKRHLSPLVWYIATCAFAVMLLAIGIGHAVQSHDWSMLAAGCAALAIVGATYPLYLVASLKQIEQVDVDRLTQPLIERLDQMAILLNLMSEQQLLSDRAKHVAFREKDREAVRRAVQEDISKGDWEAANNLIDEVEKSFGYKSEAERYRQEIANRRQEAIRRQISDVVAIVDRHTRSEQWTLALREAERLLGMFPDNEQVKNLPQEIDARRQAHKKQLISSWNEAVARHDVDGSIEILRQLDLYLTPAEGEAMQETVRGVFKEKLNNLGAEFVNNVRDHKWNEAIKIGEQIIREFPNSRAAQEVRDKMDALKKRAAEPVPVATA